MHGRVAGGRHRGLLHVIRPTFVTKQLGKLQADVGNRGGGAGFAHGTGRNTSTPRDTGTTRSLTTLGTPRQHGKTYYLRHNPLCGEHEALVVIREADPGRLLRLDPMQPVFPRLARPVAGWLPHGPLRWRVASVLGHGRKSNPIVLTHHVRPKSGLADGVEPHRVACDSAAVKTLSLVGWFVLSERLHTVLSSRHAHQGQFLSFGCRYGRLSSSKISSCVAMRRPGPQPAGHPSVPSGSSGGASSGTNLALPSTLRMSLQRSKNRDHENFESSLGDIRTTTNCFPQPFDIVYRTRLWELAYMPRVLACCRMKRR